MDNTKERRYFTGSVDFETRDGVVDENMIHGYAANFDKDSQDFGGWIERLEKNSFDDVLEDDAVALFNHDPNLVLGRNKVNVRLIQDAVGLRYDVNMPDTTLAKDVRQLVKNKIIYQSSFAFVVRKQEWEHFKDKPSIRHVVKVAKLYDVSPVTYPAYIDTTVASRSFMDEVKKNNPVIDRSLYIKIQQSILTSQTK